MYRTGAHTKYRLMYHLVWITKYRRTVLDKEVVSRLTELFKECAEVNDWKIEELNIQDNHVHMMIQLTTTISVAKAIQLFKGGSSKIIREEFPKLRTFLWGDSLWGDGYFAETVGQKNEKAIRKYIQNQ
jgi:putative transposase